MSKNKEISALTLPSAQDIQKELKRERYKMRYRRILKSTVYTLIIVAAVAALITTLVLPVVQIVGTSMEPTLTEGEIVILIKTDHLKRGDLCAFSYSNKILIKRVIGVPGDFVDIDANGNVFINGELIREPYVTKKSRGECDIELPYQVPENQYFLMGDRRDTSIDSRSTVIGCVTAEQLIGKIIFRIWPLQNISIIQ